jgi:DNA-binding MarR family transcriptional regulator
VVIGEKKMEKKKSRPSVKDSRHQFWDLCHRASDLTSRYVDCVLTKETGITYQQFLVLMAMEHTGNQGTVGNIAKQLDRTQNTLSVLLDRMKRNGLVKKSRNMTDRRLVRVVITEKGKQKLAETVKIGWGLIEELTASYSEEEMKTMVKLVSRIEKSASEKLAEFKAAAKKR